jgi:hypothetical protein
MEGGKSKMIFRFRSEVIIPAIGKVIHEHSLEFPEDSNVFGRVVAYREYMSDTFPGCKYKIIDAKEIKRK